MNTIIESRWKDYFIANGDDFLAFWKEYLFNKSKNILFIMGLGFDPRMCIIYEKIINVGGSGSRDCMIINFQEATGSSSYDYMDLMNTNNLKLKKIIPSDSKLIERKIIMISQDNKRVGSRNALKIVDNIDEIKDYNDIIIDISALPRSLYFPLIGKILYEIDAYKNIKKINLHVVVSENIKIDESISDQGIDEYAEYLPGFTSSLNSVAIENIPKIWIPILGENQDVQLVRLYNKIEPKEICPMIPLSNVESRRGDKLLIKYRTFFFDNLRVDPKNLLYADEQNPFQVYRVLYRTIKHYNDVLRPLGGCQIVITASSSKLISIGALLAAYELKNNNVGIANVDTQGYSIQQDRMQQFVPESVPFTLWLTGDCYDD
jgi:hypothetical protein